jgi:hypothetical protein
LRAPQGCLRTLRLAEAASSPAKRLGFRLDITRTKSNSKHTSSRRTDYSLAKEQSANADDNSRYRHRVASDSGLLLSVRGRQIVTSVSVLSTGCQENLIAIPTDRNSRPKLHPPTGHHTSRQGHLLSATRTISLKANPFQTRRRLIRGLE